MAEPTSDTPPRRRRRAGSATAGGGGGAGDASGQASARTSAPPRAPAKLEGKLEQLFVTPALVFKARGDDYCASIIVRGAPDLAQAWADLAKESPAVKRVLEKLLEGGAWGGVFVSTLAIALPIAQHHGAYPPEWPNPFIPAGMEPPVPHETGATGTTRGKNVPDMSRENVSTVPTGTPNGNGNGNGRRDTNAEAGPFVDRIPPDQSGVGNPGAA